MQAVVHGTLKWLQSLSDATVAVLLSLVFVGVIAVAYQWVALSAHEVRIRVVDGETLQPLAGASAEVTYDAVAVLPLPGRVHHGSTGSDGRVLLSVHEHPGNVRIERSGYRSAAARLFLTVAGPTPLESLPPRCYYGEPQTILVPLYSLPEPTLTVVLPEGFRGTFGVELLLSSRLRPEIPGKRNFELALPDDRRLRLEATQLLCRAEVLRKLQVRIQGEESSPQVRSEYDSPETVGLRTVETGWQPLRAIYVVGDRQDYVDARERFLRRTREKKLEYFSQGLEAYFIDSE